MLSNHMFERRVDVSCHPVCVAANVEMRTFFEPCPQLRTLLAHAVLHVDLLRLIARESDIEAGQQTAVAHRFQFVSIVEIRGRMLLAEEQPVAPLVTACTPLVQKAAKRCNAGSRTDHDDRRVRTMRRTKMCGFLHEYRHSDIPGTIG